MNRLKFRATLDFDIDLQDGDILEKTSLNLFGRHLVEVCKEWEGFIVGQPLNMSNDFELAYVKSCKVRRRTGK